MISLSAEVTDELAADQIQNLSRVSRFLEVVDAEPTDVHGADRYTLHESYIVDREWWDTATEVIISSENGDTVEIETFSRGANGSIPVRAALENWTVDQTPDDGNLLTTLELSHPDEITGGVAVRGPPARHGPGGIELEVGHHHESDYLI